MSVIMATTAGTEIILVTSIGILCLFVIAVVTFVTEKRNHNKELKALRKEVLAYQHERDEALSMASANAAYADELKNGVRQPVNAIRTAISLMKKEDLPISALEYCDILTLSADNLYYAVSGDAHLDREKEHDMGSERLSLPQAKFLIVDDNKVGLKVTKALLEAYDATVEVAESGYAAIDLIREGHMFDVIFMDHLMPGMDGIMATKRIHELEPDGYHTTVIALTGNTGTEVENSFFAAGMSDFLSKPLDTDELRNALIKWVPKEKQSFVKIIEEENGYSPKKFVPLYWNDEELYKDLLNMFLVEGTAIIKHLDNSPMEECKEELEVLERLTHSIRAEKLEKMVKELHAVSNLNGEELYQKLLADVKKEFAQVASKIRGYL